MAINKRNITLLDPSIETNNLGDNIISNEIKKVIKIILKKDNLTKISTRKNISKENRKLLKKSKKIFLGGTNILSSHMILYKQWKINIFDLDYLSNIILIGVGWWQYQSNPDIYTKFILKNALSRKFIHSVRDSYTKEKLSKIGISNVLVTGCPTIWNITKKHCREIPEKKSEKVVFTLTDYKRDKKRDRKLVEILKRNYEEIYFWPQGSKDIEYLKSIVNIKDIKLISRSISAFFSYLNNEKTDYVGTRLHAGIASLNKKKRTIIISIDNRAGEMGKDFNIPIIKRKNIDELEVMINNKIKTDIKIPKREIIKWKSQFKK